MKRLLGILAVAAATLAAPLGTAHAITPGQFGVACTYNHMLPDDPIVHQHQPGVTHLHDFAGATTTNAFSLESSLLRGSTTCDRTQDHSGYWVPTLLQNGVPVHAREFRLYYRGSGFDGKVVKPFPRGLRLIAGDAKVTDSGPFQPVSVASWACTIVGGGAAGDEIEMQHVPADCGGLPLRAKIVFPQCWDGVNLDSINHKSHMAYAVSRRCPATHPVVVPQLTMSIRYWVPNTRNLQLSSGGTHSLHADLMLAWTGTSQQDLVRRCINAGVNCG